MEVKSEKNFELNVDIDTVWNVLINPEKVVTLVPRGRADLNHR